MTTKPPVEKPNGGRSGELPAEVAREAAHVELSKATTPQIYAELLSRIGEDPARDGLLRTPERMEKAMEFLTRGYSQTVESVLHEALFDVDYDEMVIVKDIEFYPLCEHHLLPFFGKAHVAYLPDKEGGGAEQGGAYRGSVCAAAAGAGAADAADCRGD